MSSIQVLVIAGGSGTRFWPRSRKGKPKQFLKFWDDQTLFEHTISRFQGWDVNISVVTTQSLLEVSKRTLASFEKQGLKISFLGEPEAKNTSACILWGVSEIYKKDPEAMVCVIPADHFIGDDAEFQEALKGAVEFAMSTESIVTLGVRPNRPETGYGYILTGKEKSSKFYEVSQFVEKPELRKALEYLRSGKYLWNSGMFVFKASLGLRAFELCMPQLFEIFKSGDSVEKKYSKIDKKDAISFDFGVMEVVQEKGIPVFVKSVSFPWSDLGSYTALEEIDKAVSGNVVSYNSASNIVQSDQGLVALLGVNDLVVVKEGDIVLVANKDQCQDIRRLVEKIQKEYPAWT